MNNRNIPTKILRFFRLLYLKLFRINDSPQKIALGFGLGAFLGILPGTGPIASLVLAAVFRINKAAALLGSILTNTWASFLIIVLSIKMGAGIMGLEWQQVYASWQHLLTDFQWKNIFDLSILKLMLPVLTGYLILSFCLGLIAYCSALILLYFLKRRRDENKSRTRISG